MTVEGSREFSEEKWYLKKPKELCLTRTQLIKYGRSSPCDRSRKQAVLVTTSIAKPCLNCHLNSVIKNSRKRPHP